jgi:hypothetical protein
LHRIPISSTLVLDSEVKTANPEVCYVPNTSEDIDDNDFLDLSYVPNTAKGLTQAPAPMTMTPGGHTPGNTPFPPRVRDHVLESKKGIKPDPASFAVLKDNKQWDSVHRTLKAQTACYQDVNDVLDLSYVPNTSEDIDVDDILDLSYVPNTAEDIDLTQAPAPMTVTVTVTVTPGGHTCGNTPILPGHEILFSNSRRASNLLTRHLLLY